MIEQASGEPRLGQSLARDRSARNLGAQRASTAARRSAPSGRAGRSELISSFACEASSIAAIASSYSRSSRSSIFPIGSRLWTRPRSSPGNACCATPGAKAICGSCRSLSPRVAAPPGRLVDRSRCRLAQGGAARELSWLSRPLGSDMVSTAALKLPAGHPSLTEALIRATLLEERIEDWSKTGASLLTSSLTANGLMGRAHPIMKPLRFPGPRSPASSIHPRPSFWRRSSTASAFSICTKTSGCAPAFPTFLVRRADPVSTACFTGTISA